MNLPFGFFHPRVVRILVIGVPCVLAVVLGVLQYGWIRQAAVTEERRRLAEEERRTESALLDVRRAVESSFEDLRLAASLLRTAAGLGVRPEDVIAERALSAWLQQTAFPSLIRGAWLLSDAPEAAKTVHIAVDSAGTVTRSEVRAATLPAALRPAARLLGDRTAEASTTVDQLRTSLGNEGFVLLWTVIGTRSTSLAVLEIDIDTYLKAALPYALKREAPAYAVTVQASPQHPSRTNQGRSLIVSVPNVWYASLLRESADIPSDRAPGAPGIRFPPEDSAAFLSIELPETGRPSGVTWLVTNLAASVGILAVLLAALVGALLLYTRMRELRTAEMEFVASLSHELRLPITVIRVIGDNLRAGVVRDGRMTQYGDQLRRQTSRLSSMVESMLLSAGLQGGALPELTGFSPYAEAVRVVEDLAALVEEHRVTVNVKGPETEATVRGDANGFALVLRNLLVNAVLHAVPSPSGEPRWVRIRLSFDQPSLLCLEVSDNGPGIPRKEQKGIFEPFARTSRSLSEQHPGSGLGLHIARRVVRLNEGSLNVTSPYKDAEGVAHRGCRFVATLKYEEAPTDA